MKKVCSNQISLYLYDMKNEIVMKAKTLKSAVGLIRVGTKVNFMGKNGVITSITNKVTQIKFNDGGSYGADTWALSYDHIYKLKYNATRSMLEEKDFQIIEF